VIKKALSDTQLILFVARQNLIPDFDPIFSAGDDTLVGVIGLMVCEHPYPGLPHQVLRYFSDEG
jgi:hypothetical protein